MKNKVLSMLLALMLVITLLPSSVVFADDYGMCGDNLYWEITAGGYLLHIYGYGEMYDYSRTNPPPWYEWKDWVTEIEITGECITGEIADENLWGKVVNIGDNAFADFVNLEYIYIYNELSCESFRIGNSAFSGCENLREIYFSNEYDAVDYIGDNAFESCTSFASISDLTDMIRFSNNFNYLGTGAFSNCQSLTYVKLPDSLPTIPIYAFAGSGVRTLILGENTTEIQARAFQYCFNLKHIKLNKNLTTIKENAFAGCEDLSLVYYDGDTGGLNSIMIDFGNEAIEENLNFDGVYDGTCGDDATWKFENNVLTLDGAGQINDYYPYTDIPWFILSDDVLEIVINTGIENIINCCFDGFSKVKKIDIPDTVTTIGWNAFRGCTNLEKIMLPVNLKAIKSNTFNGCINLQNVTFPEELETIGEGAFKGCSSLERIIIPSKVTTIDRYAFENAGLEIVYIVGAINKICSGTFRNCSSLDTIVLPESISQIENYAFYMCNSLSDIYYSDTLEKWQSVTIDKYNDPLTNANLIDTYKSVSITDFTLSENEIVLPVGYEKELSVNILPEEAKMKVVKWSSSDNSIAKVDAWGCVTGISEGTAVIIAEDESGSFMEFCMVEVFIPTLVNEIKLGETQLNLVEKEGRAITATIVPDNATNKNLLWASSNENIATVDNGVVTAIAEGEAVITVTSEDGNASASCSIAVQKLYPLTGIKFDSAKLTLNAGDSHTMNVTYTPENATYKNLKWTSSKPTVATVDNGVVKALSAGTTIVVATSEDGGYKATCIITVVQPVTVTGITLNTNKFELVNGESASVIATITPADATNKNINWVSNDETIAVVENGRIQAKGVGTTKITATTEDGGYTSFCDVTVLPAQANGVTLDKSNVCITIGETDTLTATITPSVAENKNVIWKSEDESIVTVDNGVLQAVGVGTTTITVTTEISGYTDSCEVTVLPINVTGIELDKSELDIIEGKTATITTKILPENATDKTVIWSSNDDNIATVNNGVVTGVSAGTTVIIAKTNDGNLSSYCVVTVTAADIPTTGVLLNTSTMSLIEGYSDTLVATVKPDNATNKNIIWTSNNNAVATVEHGKVTAVAPGTAIIITTTEDGGHIATCIVTVSSVNQEVVSAPIASVLSGIVKENTSVILLSATKNAEIYYTLDGTAPSKESAKYTSPITITTDTNVRAIATKQGMKDSNISTFKYTLANPDLPYVNVVTNVTGNKGDITTVSVNATANFAISGGKIDLAYDNTVVELLSVSGGNIIKNVNPTINDKYKGNKIRAVWASATGVGNAGEILNVQFRILDTDSEVAYFNLETTQLSNEEGKKIIAQSGNGVLTIGEAPTATAQEYYTESSINADNKSLNVNVSANSEHNGILVVAEYDKYGRLIQLKHCDVTNIDNTYTVNLEKTISADSKIKVFIWNSFENMKPLSDVEEI